MRPRRTGLSAATDGWDDAGRRAHLHRVASLCRARGVVPPLARSGPRGPCGRKRLRRTLRLPLLETFIEEDRHAGTSFQAANWAGETAGRGRQGHAATETPKAHLDAGWRERFSEPLAPLAPLEVGAGLDRESWAEQEFGGAPLGGLSARLVTCAHHQGADAGVHRRCEGRPWSTTVSKPDNEAVTVENILQPHRHRTLQARREDGAVRAGQQHAELREARKKGWASRTRPVPGPGV